MDGLLQRSAINQLVHPNRLNRPAIQAAERGAKIRHAAPTHCVPQPLAFPVAEAHNATADVEATTRCFFELIRQGHFEQKHPDLNQKFYQIQL